MENCIFCKIISGKIPSAKIYEDEHSLSFLDINPANKGHCLVVPKKHSIDLVGTDDATLGHLLQVSKKVAKAVSLATECSGYNLHISNGKDAGQEVFHLHLHIVPRFLGDGIEFQYGVKSYAETEMKEYQEKIKKFL
jgi:histidine triad (HIT) family protein